MLKNLTVILLMASVVSGAELQEGPKIQSIGSAAESLPPIHLSEHHLRILKTMKESDIGSIDGVQELYRIVWGRSCVRYQSDGKMYLKRTVVLAPDYKSIQLEHQEEISSQEWKKIRQEVDATEFWMMPARDGRFGFDGYDFSVEALRNGNIHSVYVWSPRVQTRFEEFCRKEVGDLKSQAQPSGKRHVPR